MKTQVLFKMEKKLKDSAMKKARTQGMTLSSFFTLAASALVENKIDVGIRLREEAMADNAIDAYKKERAAKTLRAITSLSDLR